MTDPLDTAFDQSIALRITVDGDVTLLPIHDEMTLGTVPFEVDFFFRPTGAAKPNFVTAMVRKEDGVWTLYSLDEHAPIILSEDLQSWCLKLYAGARFSIGVAEFECVAGSQEAEAATEVIARVERQECPRCRQDLDSIDPAAEFCPHCGVQLPSDCPHWPPLEPVPIAKSLTNRWRTWLPGWLRGRQLDPLFFARRTSVLAYVNTLFNLGLRNEAGATTTRNLVESRRYYRRAAQLGHIPARVRIKVKHLQ